MVLEAGVLWGEVCACRNLPCGSRGFGYMACCDCQFMVSNVEFMSVVPLVLCNSKETMIPKLEDITALLHELLLHAELVVL